MRNSTRDDESIDQLLGMLMGTEHHHKCPDRSCGRMWSHKESDFRSSEEHTKGHQCPACGRKQYWKFRGDGTPY